MSSDRYVVDEIIPMLDDGYGPDGYVVLDMFREQEVASFAKSCPEAKRHAQALCDELNDQPTDTDADGCDGTNCRIPAAHRPAVTDAEVEAAWDDALGAILSGQFSFSDMRAALEAAAHTRTTEEDT